MSLSRISETDDMNIMSVRARRALFESSSNGATANGRASLLRQQKTGDTVPNNNGHVSGDSSQIQVQSRVIASNNDSDKSRAPLGYLSPNFKPRRFNQKRNDHKVTHATTNTDGGYFQQRSFSSDILNTATDSRDDVPDKEYIVFCEKESTVMGGFQGETHEENLEELNKKLHQIQIGLLEIEGERSQLVSKVRQLELEKESVTKQLLNREREIESLRKRCMFAAEHSKESSVLRTKNYVLTELVSELKMQLDEKDNESMIASELKQQLHEIETERDELKERLSVIQVDYASVSDSLAMCIKNVDKLTIEKKEWEDEKLRLTQESEMLLEQQRLDHIQATTELRQELKIRERKVNDLDRLLQDKVGSIQRLRTQLSQVEASQADTLKLMTIEYDRKIQDIQNKVATEVEKKMHAEMLELQAKLSEKSAEIEALRKDVSTHMQELMVATSELQKLEEDSATLDSLFRDVEVLQLERFELSETLHERDTEIAELSAEILKLEIEKELCMQDATKLQELTDALDLANREIVSSEARLFQIVEASNHLEAEILRINTNNDEAMSLVRAECDATISALQTKLHIAEENLTSFVDSHGHVLAAKDETIAYLSAEKNSIAVNFEMELSSLRDEMRKAELAFSCNEALLRETREADLSDKDAIIDSLRATIFEMTRQHETQDIESSLKIEELERDIKEVNKKCSYLEIVLGEGTAQHQGEVSSLVQSKERLLQENEDLQCTIIEQSRRLDDFKISGRKSAIRTDTKISQLEEQVRQLKATTLDMENYSQVCSREYIMEIESMKRTILELESANEVLKLTSSHHQTSLKDSRTATLDQKLVFDSDLLRLHQELRERDLKISELEDDSEHQHLEHTTCQHSLETAISKLQMEIEMLTNANEALQSSLNEKNEASNEHKLSIEKLNVTIDDLRRERDFANISLLSCEGKLDSERILMAQLSAKYESLQSEEKILRDECDALRETFGMAMSDRNTVAAEMEKEYNLQKSELGTVRSQLASSEQNLINYEGQMSQLEVALQDRTHLLADAVAKSKELQGKIARSNTEYRAMEEQSSTLQIRVLDVEDELKRCINEWKLKEDDYLAGIDKERNLREILESDLAAIIARLESTKIESRDLIELEKENVTLKDKIRRQEAYLQRKIEQEKAVRERIVPCGNVKASANVFKTPLRSTNKESSRKSIASSTTKSTIPENESTDVDVDLDTLLAD